MQMEKEQDNHLYLTIQELSPSEKIIYMTTYQNKFLEYIENYPEEATSSILKIEVNLFAILKELEAIKMDKQVKKIMNLLKPFLTDFILETFSNLLESIFRWFFEYFSNSMNYVEGFDFFKQCINLGNKMVFYNHRGYLFFFSYQLKDYTYIQPFLKQKIFVSEFNSYKASRDFSLFCFYKGLIHLSLKEFTKAVFSFCYCIKNAVKVSLKVIDIFQIYSLERLILLSFIVDDYVNKEIDLLIKEFESFKGADHFFVGTLFNLYFSEKTLSDLLQFISLNSFYIVQKNLKGLVIYAIEELKFKKIKALLKCYKNIRLQFIAKFVNLSEKEIICILEKKVNEGMINVRYDEKDNVIEVIDCNYSNSLTISKLKELYVENVEMCKELANYNEYKLNKSKEIQTNGEALSKYMKKKQIPDCQINLEHSEWIKKEDGEDIGLKIYMNHLESEEKNDEKHNINSAYYYLKNDDNDVNVESVGSGDIDDNDDLE